MVLGLRRLQPEQLIVAKLSAEFLNGHPQIPARDDPADRQEVLADRGLPRRQVADDMGVARNIRRDEIRAEVQRTITAIPDTLPYADPAAFEIHQHIHIQARRIHLNGCPQPQWLGTVVLNFQPA